MKKITLTYFTTFLFAISFGQFKPQGTFIGLEKIKKYVDAANPKRIWYHLSVLTFKGDSAFLEQSPVAIYKTDTIFSASDGGFYSYSGTIEKYQGKIFADLKLKSCDYCPNKFIKFTPPKIVTDEDTTKTSLNDTSTITEPQEFENTSITLKIMILEKTKSIDAILVNKNIYRRQKKK